MSMDPGPRDSSVLHLQSQHRSDVVWKAGGGDCQRSRKRDPTQNKFFKVHERMIPILADLRFDGVSRLASIDLDWGLLTALIEHWRPETHTFHLPVGECSITLQDVNVLLGLRIDGDAVTGGTQVNGGWENLVKQIFGKAPGTSLKGARLLLSWLTTNYKTLHDDASDVELIRYTQSYLLQLFAGVLFSDHSGGQIHCMYLPLIQDFGRCRTLAWGSAVLAFLYRELCKACKIGVRENAGCLILLQLWAWTRLPTLAHVPRGPSLDNSVIWGDRSGPYGMRWCSHFGMLTLLVCIIHELVDLTCSRFSCSIIYL
ncbi:serine/threonine-protein phosphatase 7 long form-like [Heracleum sosnowskyi]|uniref:Serine/threonine-protein phosphatase 7 long form-like n=1 Tax=Heracleum sosnowskyi TaxID=360622 RepID=A0AAD8ICD4_9APIA|nr:serine/threonine-protein phosphatase 7 long form-like [Heracleum sosnowskyi]